MFTAVVIPEVTEDLVHRTWNWYDKTLADEPKLNAGTIVLIEIMQKEAFHSSGGRTSTAWPRAAGRHILQIGSGSLNKNNTPDIHRKGLDALAECGDKILDDYAVKNCLPRDFEEFHDPVQVGCQPSDVSNDSRLMHSDVR